MFNKEEFEKELKKFSGIKIKKIMEDYVIILFNDWEIVFYEGSTGEFLLEATRDTKRIIVEWEPKKPFFEEVIDYCRKIVFENFLDEIPDKEDYVIETDYGGEPKEIELTVSITEYYIDLRRDNIDVEGVIEDVEPSYYFEDEEDEEIFNEIKRFYKGKKIWIAPSGWWELIE